MSRSLKLKKAVSSGVYRLPWREGIIRFMQRSAGVILAYHRVLNHPEDEVYPVQKGMYVTGEDFRSHLSFLSSYYDIISLEQMIDRIHEGAGRSLQGTCSITFDDGWRDNYVNAFPIIREFHVPVTIFLSVRHIDTGEVLWPEKFGYLFRRVECESILDCGLQDRLGILGLSFHKESDAVIDALKGSNEEERNQLLHLILELSGEHLPNRRLIMNWDEVREMELAGIAFGSHSMNHRILTSLPEETVRQEIGNSFARLKEMGLNPSPVFCYPNGNYSPRIIELVKEAGYIGALTLERRYINRLDDCFALGRITMHHDISSTVPLFAFRIFSGLSF